jgi:hypothetical protein
MEENPYKTHETVPTWLPSWQRRLASAIFFLAAIPVGIIGLFVVIGTAKFLYEDEQFTDAPEYLFAGSSYVIAALNFVFVGRLILRPPRLTPPATQD